VSNPFDQARFDVRCDWGQRGLEALAPSSDVVVVVDVLSFSTCVEVATARGARILPCRWKDDSAVELARTAGADLAGPRGESRFSLSPATFMDVAPGTKVVLPSPNGATLTLGAGERTVLAGCLRNASAVARAASRSGRRVSVIAAGERWPDGSLRPCLEDWLGAGSIVAGLAGSLSPEARAARATFEAASAEIGSLLHDSGSARELVERGYEEDVAIASEVDVSEVAPLLDGLGFVEKETGGRG
jgi:2-phosphosulfolactate phosphatase